MEQYSNKELDLKIQAFMARKTAQYPELMSTKKVKKDSTRLSFASAPFISSMRALKPQLLG